MGRQPTSHDDLERISALYEKAKAKVNEQSDEIDRLRRACPCSRATPCGPLCTCANPAASGGCERCCRWGSEAQRQALAEEIAATPPGRCASAILRCAADWNASGQTLEAWLAHAELRHGQAEAVAAIRGTCMPSCMTHEKCRAAKEAP